MTQAPPKVSTFNTTTLRIKFQHINLGVGGISIQLIAIFNKYLLKQMKDKRLYTSVPLGVEICQALDNISITYNLPSADWPDFLMPADQLAVYTSEDHLFLHSYHYIQPPLGRLTYSIRLCKANCSPDLFLVAIPNG